MDVCQLLVGENEGAVNIQDKDLHQTTLTQSKACFEAVLRLYFHRHGFEGSDMYLNHHLTVLAFAATRKHRALTESLSDNDETTRKRRELRDTIVLVSKGLIDQSSNYYLPVDIFNTVQASIPQEELASVNRYLTDPNQSKQKVDRRTIYNNAQYPINIVSIIDHTQDQRLGALVKRYSTLSMETTHYVEAVHGISDDT